MEQQILDFLKAQSVVTYYIVASYLFHPLFFKIVSKMSRYESGYCYQRYVSENKGSASLFCSFLFFILSPIFFVPMIFVCVFVGFFMFFPCFLRWMTDLPLSKNHANKLAQEWEQMNKAVVPPVENKVVVPNLLVKK